MNAEGSENYRFVTPKSRKKRRPNPAFVNRDKQAQQDRAPDAQEVQPSNTCRSQVEDDSGPWLSQLPEGGQSPAVSTIDGAAATSSHGEHEETLVFLDDDAVIPPIPPHLLMSWSVANSPTVNTAAHLEHETDQDGGNETSLQSQPPQAQNLGSPSEMLFTGILPDEANPLNIANVSSEPSATSRQGQTQQNDRMVRQDHRQIDGGDYENSGININEFLRSPPTGPSDLYHFGSYSGARSRQQSPRLEPSDMWGQSWSPSLSFHNVRPAVTIQSLIEMYNNRYCALPVTNDSPSNPFRCQMVSYDKPTPLLHSFLAIAYYHLSRQTPNAKYGNEIQFHKGAARHSFKKEFEEQKRKRSAKDLDATLGVLILIFTFEASQSACANWSQHLQCAYQLVEGAGGPQALGSATRLQAQLAVFLWWDITIAALSREDAVFPYSYFETLLELEHNGAWCFWNLTGCPRELFVPLVQLTHMAAEREKVLKMRFTSFNTHLVDEIEESIVSWMGPLKLENEGESADEESMHLLQDQIHCYEAWRCCLLLYIQRIFRWDRKTAPSTRIKILSRRTLDHVRSCRMSSIISKQVLFPVLLAGSELFDADYQQTASEYCRIWHQKSGYRTFAQAGSLLEDIWLQQDGLRSGSVWWGSVVDKAHANMLGGERFKLG